jgi:hypothetical protein
VALNVFKQVMRKAGAGRIRNAGTNEKIAEEVNEEVSEEIKRVRKGKVSG